MKRFFPLALLLLASPLIGQDRPALQPSSSDVGPTRATITWATKAEVVGTVEYGTTEKLGKTRSEAEPRSSHKIVLDGLEPDTCYYYRVVAGDLASSIEIVKTPPVAFHVPPYLQLPTPTSMTIMWETNDLLDGVVEYGPTEALGQSVAENAGPMRLHQVTVTGLEPGRTYHYRVRSSTAVSAIEQFRTAPLPGTPRWRMAVYGDSRSNPHIHSRVVEQIAKANVDLIVHTGDIVLDGRNHASWRREWFAPLAPLRGHVPWVSTIGNHERDSTNYYSYAALPGNEQYFSFNYGNASIICLDSNTWLAQGRDGLQYQWMEKTLKATRDATWTFVVFHHPLFSAHRTRPINSLRWQWAPLFLDPAARIDAVLNGHDHFYARNFPLALASDGPTRGVQFITSAGGGADLYPLRERDYLDKIRSVHHFTLLEFDGDRIQGSAIDLNGNVFDRFEMTKQPTPAERLCAYEVEEMKESLRKAMARSAAVEVRTDQPTAINTSLEIPTRFRIATQGTLRWGRTPGWSLPEPTSFRLKAGEPLRIPLQAEAQAAGLATTPMLTIEFDAGLFRNRIITTYPFKLTNPPEVVATNLRGMVDGQVEAEWDKARPAWLLPANLEQIALPKAPGMVRFASDGEHLFVAARLASPAQVKPRDPTQTGSKVVLAGEHVRVELAEGKKTRVFALSAEHLPYYALDGTAEELSWPAAAAQGDGFWTAEMAIPLALFTDRQALRVNVVHRTATGQEYELRPSFALGQNPDVIPHWQPATTSERFARLILPALKAP